MDHKDDLILPFQGMFSKDFVQADVEYGGHEYWIHCKYNTATVGETVCGEAVDVGLFRATH